MGNYQSSGRGGNRSGNRRFGGRDSGRGRGGGRFGGRRDRKPQEMHDVICDECGEKCQVPFKPSGDKPVLCSDCFKKSGGSKGGERSSEQLEEINKKLDKILGILGPTDIYESESS